MISLINIPTKIRRFEIEKFPISNITCYIISSSISENTLHSVSSEKFVPNEQLISPRHLFNEESMFTRSSISTNRPNRRDTARTFFSLNASNLKHERKIRVLFFIPEPFPFYWTVKSLIRPYDAF